MIYIPDDEPVITLAVRQAVFLFNEYAAANADESEKHLHNELIRLARLGASLEAILCSSCGGDGYPRNGCHTFESKTECGDCYGSGLASNEKHYLTEALDAAKEGK